MNLQHFEFYELLGQGASGEVFRALDKTIGKIV
jgi:hypothetical protein